MHLAALPGAGRVLRAPVHLRAAALLSLLSLDASAGGLETPDAAALFTRAWRRRYGRDPSPAELHALLCVSRFDGGLGAWPKTSAMFGSRNLAALECRHKGTDCSPVAQGGASCAPLSTWERVNGQRVEMVECFRTYDNWDSAADDYLREMTAPIRHLTGTALASGSLRTLTDAMYREHFFTADKEAYALALWEQEKAICKRLGLVSPVVTLGGPVASAPAAAPGGALLLGALAAAGAGSAWWWTRRRAKR